MMNSDFSFQTRDGKTPGTTIVKLTGPLTLRTMFEVQAQMAKVKVAVLILDLEDCPYMDSAGLGLVINQYVSAQKDGRRLLVTGLNDQIRTLMTVTRMNTVLPVFATVEDAESSLKEESVE